METPKRSFGDFLTDPVSSLPGTGYAAILPRGADWLIALKRWHNPLYNPVNQFIGPPGREKPGKTTGGQV